MSTKDLKFLKLSVIFQRKVMVLLQKISILQILQVLEALSSSQAQI